MSIPTKPLEVRAFEPAKASLGELTLFRHPESLAPDEQIAVFIRFCEKYTNWSRLEILDITAEEVADVAKQLAEKLQQVSVPKANLPPSKPGRGKRRPASQPG